MYPKAVLTGSRIEIGYFVLTLMRQKGTGNSSIWIRGFPQDIRRASDNNMHYHGFMGKLLSDRDVQNFPSEKLCDRVQELQLYRVMEYKQFFSYWNGKLWIISSTYTQLSWTGEFLDLATGNLLPNLCLGFLSIPTSLWLGVIWDSFG